MGSGRSVPRHYLVHLIAQYCQEEDAKVEEVFDGALISIDSFFDGDTITFEEQLRIYRYLARMSRPGFGLRSGLALSTGMHDELGYVMRACSTVREALEMGGRYAQTQGPLFDLTLHEEADIAIVRASDVEALGEARLLAVEEQIAVWHSAQLPSAEVVNSAIEVRVDYPAPAHHHLYEELLTTPVRFDCPYVEAVLPRSILDSKLETASSKVQRTLERQLTALSLESDHSANVVDRVRSALARRPPRWADRREIALELGMSERTLVGQLKAHATSFRKESERHMRMVSEYYLRSTSISVDDVATLMGYANPANFYRAFRRWHGGRTPTEVREAKSMPASDEPEA